MLRRIQGQWAFSTYDPSLNMTILSFLDPIFDKKLLKEAAKLERQEYIFSFLNPEE
jgi:hypothetical protein